MTDIQTKITHIEIPIESEVWMSVKHALREAGYKFYFQPNLFEHSHVNLFLERRSEDPEGHLSHGFIVHDGGAKTHIQLPEQWPEPNVVEFDTPRDAHLAADILNKQQEEFRFADKPAAKSSTSVLNASVCQSCGCKLDGQPLRSKAAHQEKCFWRAVDFLIKNDDLKNKLWDAEQELADLKKAYEQTDRTQDTLIEMLSATVRIREEELMSLRQQINAPFELIEVPECLNTKDALTYIHGRCT